MSETTFIWDNHWGGGSTKRWVVDKYLISATFSTGSNIYVESLDFPGHRESGWFYMMESVDECVARLISKLKHEWKHACWRVDSKRVNTESGGYYTTYGSIKYIDQLTEEKIKEIESDPNFNCWEYINVYTWGKFVTKTVYNPNKFSYEKLPFEDIKSC